jgi:hypothetical protein
MGDVAELIEGVEAFLAEPLGEVEFQVAGAVTAAYGCSLHGTFLRWFEPSDQWAREPCLCVWAWDRLQSAWLARMEREVRAEDERRNLFGGPGL